MLAALALSAVLSGQAHWVAWGPELVQMGVSVGEQADERLILMVTPAGCSAGMKIYSGRVGDFEKALRVVEKSKMCADVEERAAIKGR